MKPSNHCALVDFIQSNHLWFILNIHQNGWASIYCNRRDIRPGLMQRLMLSLQDSAAGLRSMVTDPMCLGWWNLSVPKLHGVQVAAVFSALECESTPWHHGAAEQSRCPLASFDSRRLKVVLRWMVSVARRGKIDVGNKGFSFGMPADWGPKIIVDQCWSSY